MSSNPVSGSHTSGRHTSGSHTSGNAPHFFTSVPDRIVYAGPDTLDPLSFRWYDPDRIVLGKTMEEHLRFAACYWHSFAWDGSDIFGHGTMDRPWIGQADEMAAARAKMDAAFEFFDKLGIPFWCFHDVDIAPPGRDFAETTRRLEAMVDYAGHQMDRTGVQLLWGTANLFAHPRYQAGAATNPDPEVFARAAAQVKVCLEATHRLGGANYVLWGGREGYDTLLNTDMAAEQEQLARFLSLVIEHKGKIGFDGLILLEPKPFEPTKHQYDHDVATVHGFLERFDLVGEVFVNIEANHATLSGHDFAHEVATAFATGTFGSVDANAGDDRLGWDVDRFPVSAEQMTLGMYEILKGGGFTSGGLNFDAKLRRQSIERDDLFHAHVGGMDTIAKSLLAAARLIEDRTLSSFVEQRYADWDGELGRSIRNGVQTLSSLHDRQLTAPDPVARSGRQELLENAVAKAIDSVR
ncbi:MAG: xylose isomerase [Actinomycetota bacterium]